MTDTTDIEIEELKRAVQSLDARLKVLEEERRTLHEGILQMREEDLVEKRLEL